MLELPILTSAEVSFFEVYSHNINYQTLAWTLPTNINTSTNKRYAVALMGDYLPDPLTTELAQHIGIDMKKHEVRAKSVTAIEKDEKSIRGKSAEGVKQTGGDNPTADYTKLNSKATTAKKQRVVKGRSAVLKKINTRGNEVSGVVL
ncbi:hypothetical protein SARC_11538 [Sphaeroforma arctica JP610]|uniref:Uncharacterized protein n=1 Tax=Sphaeroforma arctica JP610 TaxID=667725 RepID=A0A0L0FHK0_9EUKA|nr:hypothetical protein SARC_11538 [Sphaeroforma arctica JP610]KNC75946.1 hypothetical protein SARC_11538 [Sphaeroforma arctica JP610]|eukprot:XP_014149848.1 hypothetical protein SARC_11538 [Sphaeroforma arctica JP610]